MATHSPSRRAAAPAAIYALALDHALPPVDDTADDQSEAPVDDTADDQSEAPVDDTADDQGEAPVDDTADDQGEAPADDTADDRGEAPADDAVDAQGGIPEAEYQGDIPVNSNNSDASSDSFNSLTDYMNAHNYGPDDFATYSQDPVWRDLQKQAYPDYDLPPLTQENALNQLSDYMNAHNYGPDDFATYSQDPEWRDLQRQAFPDYELPPLNKADNIGHWSEIPPDTSFKDNLDAANPNYELGDEWQVNCQRCVPTYEMRARGYDVTAKPCVDDNDYLSYNPYDVWENPDVMSASGNGLSDIQSAMSNWGDGSRAQVCVQWEYGDGGHTFMAEQRNGKTYFFDPQTGDTDVSWYFNEIHPGSTSFCRTDQLMPTNRILDCCKGGNR